MICLGLYKSLAQRHKVVYLPVKAQYFPTLKYLLSPIKNIRVIRIPVVGSPLCRNCNDLGAMKILSWLFRLTGSKIISLGYLGHNYLTKTSDANFDENFYIQAEVAFDERWDVLEIPRRNHMESRLEHELGNPQGPYIFLHDDSSRGMTIDRRLVRSDLSIIQPKRPHGEFFISDYLGVISRASEIHVIESSFSALIEGIHSPAKKYLHRYARPEPKLDTRQHQTMRGDWVFLNESSRPN